MHPSDTAEHRLPPRAIPLFAVHAIRELLPILVIALVSGRLDLEELGFWLFAGSAAIGLGFLNWYTTRFAFLPEHVSLKSGLLFREHRQLPWARIQNLSVTRGPLHRLLGISHLRIESASGAGTEINLNGMTAAQIDDLRKRFDALQAPPAGSTGDPSAADGTVPPFKQLGTGELVRLGLIENRGLIVIGAAFGVLAQSDELIRPLFNTLHRLQDRFPRLAIDPGDPLGQVLLWGSVLLAWLIVVRLFSVAHAIWTHHGFTLRIDGDRLRVEEGLLTRKQLSARIPRIQRVSLREGLLHRLGGRAAIRIATAAQVALNETGTQLRDVLPLGTPDDARRLLPILLPGWDWRPLGFERLPARALARAYLTRLPAWTLAVILGGLHSTAAALILSTLGTLHLLQVFLDHLNARLGVDRNGLILLRIGLSRRAEFLPKPRIQARSLSQSPLDRAFGLARIRLDVAGGGAMSWLTLPPLELEQAIKILRQLEAASATPTQGCG
ncbi:MAG: PH domain-containing protein [Xanthomonadales bacterium]|jgi:putative membrane protein|nr:PH domain-containing protein [Xanthomonadales bacterium]